MESQKPGTGIVKTNKVIEDTKEESSLERFGSANPYIVLGVSENASAKEILFAYRKLILKHHPEKSKDPKAAEISRYLFKAYKKLIAKDGSLLNYNSEKDTDQDESGFDWDQWDASNFGDSNVSDEEWYAGSGFWEYTNEARRANERSGQGLKNEEETQLEKEFVLSLFADPKYNENSPENNHPEFDATKKYLYTNSLIQPDFEEKTFTVVGTRLVDKNGVIENSINFGRRSEAWRLKKRIYNSTGKIVFDGAKEKDPLRGDWYALEAPPFLYHGTVDDTIEEFEPRSAIERPEEEPQVYASPDIEIAAQSMANKFVSNGGIVNRRKFVCIPMTKEEFLKQDHGGTIYKLPGDSFKPNLGRGFGGEMEWISNVPVRPEEKIKIPSLLEAMLKQGTEVYFIKPEMAPVITKAQKGDPKNLEAVLATLESEKSA